MDNNESPDAAMRRAAAVSEVVAALVKVDASEREAVITAARAIVGNAPAAAVKPHGNHGHALASMTSR